ncbi:NupC/NupG family nucleoside CNT transporter, partial [Vibrio nigripulchritudo]
MSLFMSLVGIVVLLGIAVLLSGNRKAINFRTVGGAFAIQFALGAFVLYIPWGRDLLAAFSAGVQNVIDYGKDGTGFLFGSLVNFSVDGIGFIFAFQVLPTLIFFSALISVLYYIGVMQWVIKILGGALQKALGTSRAESMSAAANIFVGQTEAPLVVRPFVPKMTQSELFAVMCGGLASVAGGVLAGYASMGVPLEYLVAASFMAAPGGLLFAKIIMPETEAPKDD